MNVFVLATMLAQTTVATQAPGTPPPLAPPPGAATIAHSGSTNTVGYTLIVAPDGSATVAQDGVSEPKSVAAPQARWLFAKLREADPVDSLGGGHCMKSASFGTTTVVTWNGHTSSDLSCDDSAASRELLRTIRVIAGQLAVATFRHGRRLRLP